jgi:hypothetical protein
VANYAIAVRTNGLAERVCAGIPLSFFEVGAWLLSPRAGNVASSNLSRRGGPLSYKLNEIEFDQIRSSALYLGKNISNAHATFTFQNGALDVKYS